MAITLSLILNCAKREIVKPIFEKEEIFQSLSHTLTDRAKSIKRLRSYGRLYVYWKNQKFFFYFDLKYIKEEDSISVDFFSPFKIHLGTFTNWEDIYIPGLNLSKGKDFKNFIIGIPILPKNAHIEDMTKSNEYYYLKLKSKKNSYSIKIREEETTVDYIEIFDKEHEEYFKFNFKRYIEYDGLPMPKSIKVSSHEGKIRIEFTKIEVYLKD